MQEKKEISIISPKGLNKTDVANKNSGKSSERLYVTFCASLSTFSGDDVNIAYACRFVTACGRHLPVRIAAICF